MKWWTADASFFWPRAIGALVSLFVIGAFCHTSIYPSRFYLQDTLIFLPLVLCILLSVRSAKRVDLLTRWAFGFFQGSLLLSIYENEWRDALLDWKPTSFVYLLVLLVAVYASAFALITQYLSQRFRRAPDLSHCHECGYLLKGLTVARCPECGTPFDPALLAINRVDTQDPPQQQQDGNS
jgi:hypothetical protein